MPTRAAGIFIGYAVLAAVAGFAAVGFAIPAMPPCAWTTCGQVPWAALGLGLALAVAIVAWMHRTAAEILAVLAAAAWRLALREGHPPTWVTVSFALLVSGGAILALTPWRGTSDRFTISASSSAQQPPAETRFTWVAARTTATSIVLLALGSGLLWWLLQWRLPWWFGSEGVWGAWAAAAIGLGLGLGWRAVSLNRSRRRFFASPQPVRPVQVVEHSAGVYVWLPGSAVAHIPIKARFPARLEMQDGPRWVWRGANADSGRKRPALLYGDPLTTRWCAVVLDSKLLAPFGSIEALSDPHSQTAAASATDDGEGDGPGEGGRELGFDPADLTAVDRSASPDLLRTHRLARERAYALVPLSIAAVALGATMVGFVTCIGAFHPSVSVLVALGLAGLGAEIVWRVLVRPRAAWNDEGIAVVTGRGVQHLPWRDVSSIELDEGVKLRAEGADHVIAVHRISRWLAPGERSPQQLVAALRDSKRRAAGTPAAHLPPPPPLDYPLRSPVLWVLASGSAIVLAYVLLAIANSGR
ncbi:hypothetical protein Rhe02_45060 [Rhizocola hellebori]|uniref:Low molecular weight protein antigen 6 PH domain-containing protein n=1 Tax=Rhizocola hellebori TaxID=1392758 RepID=A0A8J3QAJ6_9ACTN|nr:PH domain-containing protein [Rhizocola hellebori]GIH06439.1 hypothetical protein Rhe02_45060 [Rhizocola hellebori]